MLLEGLATAFHLARSVDYTTNGFPSRIPTQVEPSGDGVVDLSGWTQSLPVGQFAQGAVIIGAIGTGADNATFSFRVYGWKIVGFEQGPNKLLWVPTNLAEFQVTLSTSVGVAGSIIDNNHRFADTYTLTTGSTGATIIDSPANDTIGFVEVALKGFQKMELTFTTGGSATACNALYSLRTNLGW